MSSSKAPRYLSSSGSHQSRTISSSNDTKFPGNPLPTTFKNAILDSRILAGHFLDASCIKCRAPLMKNFNLLEFFAAWLKNASIPKKGRPTTNKYKASLCVKECKKCHALTCIGCGRLPTQGKYDMLVKGLDIMVKSRNGNIKNVGTDWWLDWCCNDGRMFCVWLLLSRYDGAWLRLKAKSEEAAAKRNERKRCDATPMSRGIGFEERGVVEMKLLGHFSRGLDMDRKTVATEVFNFGEEDRKTNLLTVLLPPPQEKPHDYLSGLLNIGMLLDKVAELFHNDCVDNVVARCGLYSAAMSFVDRLQMHPALANLVQAKQYTKKETCGLQTLSTPTSVTKKQQDEFAIAQMVTLGSDKAWPVIKYLENLKRQTTLMRKANIRSGDPKDREALDLFQRIEKLHKDYTSKAESTQPSNGLTKREKWALYHKENCVTYEDNILDSVNDDFREKAERLHHSGKGRMKRLMTELISLSTSLPEGIFVKAGESRLDVLKCLIVGPSETPYEGGLFEFDILCPEEYPKLPPALRFRSGIPHAPWYLNPNLHSDGEVCFSLLGTWDEGSNNVKWQPTKSTLLQLLVSIQSMVFVPHPFLNEPDWSNKTGKEVDAKSRLYNERIQPLVVRFAITSWLTNPQRRNGIWKPVLRRYFECNAKTLVGTVERWGKGNQLIERWDGWMVVRFMSEWKEKANFYKEGSGSNDFLRGLKRALGEFGYL
ncbi:MAG: hypothetical protein M1834_009051 [Cirrosporium novae-zelandiae]|nr:MAG: hypothetical protein M1834_009051 [Cirrosporium novae-zelandiae]